MGKSKLRSKYVQSRVKIRILRENIFAQISCESFRSLIHTMCVEERRMNRFNVQFVIVLAGNDRTQTRLRFNYNNIAKYAECSSIAKTLCA